jgi:hypothetical protein
MSTNRRIALDPQRLIAAKKTSRIAFSRAVVLLRQHYNPGRLASVEAREARERTTTGPRTGLWRRMRVPNSRHFWGALPWRPMSWAEKHEHSSVGSDGLVPSLGRLSLREYRLRIVIRQRSFGLFSRSRRDSDSRSHRPRSKAFFRPARIRVSRPQSRKRGQAAFRARPKAFAERRAIDVDRLHPTYIEAHQRVLFVLYPSPGRPESTDR